MGILGNISGRDSARAFQKAGWRVTGQVGNHLVLVEDGVRANVSVPQPVAEAVRFKRHHS